MKVFSPFRSLLRWKIFHPELTGPKTHRWKTKLRESSSIFLVFTKLALHSGFCISVLRSCVYLSSKIKSILKSQTLISNIFDFHKYPRLSCPNIRSIVNHDSYLVIKGSFGISLHFIAYFKERDSSFMHQKGKRDT